MVMFSNKSFFSKDVFLFSDFKYNSINDIDFPTNSGVNKANI